MFAFIRHTFPNRHDQDDSRAMTDEDNQSEVSKGRPPAADRGVYGISVASELSGIAEQSLRLYERQGLLTPARSAGGTRRYSADDLVRLQRISELVAAGVNLVGIERILSLEDRNAALDERNVTLEGDNDALRTADSRRPKAKQAPK
jgi:DNA-binding transcriptional MerR regulator